MRDFHDDKGFVVLVYHKDGYELAHKQSFVCQGDAETFQAAQIALGYYAHVYYGDLSGRTANDERLSALAEADDQAEFERRGAAAEFLIEQTERNYGDDR
jgi:hypothetical protein